MRGLRPVQTVGEMKRVMNLLPDDLPLVCMPEDGPTFTITGCINLTSSTPKQCWLIIEEIDDVQLGDGIVDADWEHCELDGAPDDDPEDSETIYIDVEPIIENPDRKDCIRPRGLIKSA